MTNSPTEEMSYSGHCCQAYLSSWGTGKAFWGTDLRAEGGKHHSHKGTRGSPAGGEQASTEGIAGREAAARSDTGRVYGPGPHGPWVDSSF